MIVKSTAPLALALLLGTGGQAAFAAQSDDPSEAAALAFTRVAASQAVAAVEARNKGKVVEVELLCDGSTAVYHVTAQAPDGTESSFAVDADTGAVVATIDMKREDKRDRGDAGAEDHEDDERDNGPNKD